MCLYECLRLVLGQWSSCSNNCGQGFRVQAPSCIVLMSDGSSREVAREECASSQNVTRQTQSCLEQLCPRWRTGTWSLVSSYKGYSVLSVCYTHFYNETNNANCYSAKRRQHRLTFSAPPQDFSFPLEPPAAYNFLSTTNFSLF